MNKSGSTIPLYSSAISAAFSIGPISGCLSGIFNGCLSGIFNGLVICTVNRRSGTAVLPYAGNGEAA